jgi:flagellar biosynthesis protein FlhB
MAGDKDGKTEKPTAKRKSEARKEGRIARSQELVQWVAIFIGMTMLERTVNSGAKFLQEEMNKSADLMAHPDIHTDISFMASSVGKAFMIVMPLTLLFMVISVIGHLAQVRFVLTFSSIKPSFNKINPLTGFKRIFSPSGLFQAGKQMIKLIILGALVYMTIYKTMTGLTMNGPYATNQILHVVAKSVVSFVREVAAVGIVIGVVDYLWSRKKTNDGMKMSKQEVKEETRQQDLPPEVRGALRRKQRQMSRNRMMAAMKNADVVIVNPVHIAVALEYNPQRSAPRVLAKGAGFVAEKIREKAEEENIPLVQDIPLARALHKSCEIDDEIPAALFQAVARVLAFVFSLKSRGTSQGFHKMPGTPDLEDVEPLDERELVTI